MSLMVLLAAAALSTQAPGAASQNTVAGVRVTPAPAAQFAGVPMPGTPYGDQKVCKPIKLTGSRVAGNRVCATRAEWFERSRDDQRSLEQVVRDAGKVPFRPQ